MWYNCKTPHREKTSGNVRSGKCPVGEVSGRGSAHWGSVHWGSVHWGSVRRGSVRESFVKECYKFIKLLMVELLVICVIKLGNRRNLANLPCVFQDIKCWADRYLNSFFPGAISVWNYIISNFEYLPTFGRLKNHLISLIRPKSRSTSDLHNSIYLRHLFQFRVGLSYLRYHKNRYNSAGTPSDICLCRRGVEDKSHFLFFCPVYLTHRETFTARVNEILRRNNLDFITNTELYLYRHSSLKNLDTQKILAATIEYIKNTNRFST